MVPDIDAAASKVDPASKTKGLDENSKLKLQKAVKGFESIFVNYLLQNMRKTALKSDEEGDGFGGELMQGMFDLEIAKSVSQHSSLGIGEMLYKQMTGESLPKVVSQPAEKLMSAPVQASPVIAPVSKPADQSPAAPAIRTIPDMPLAQPAEKLMSPPDQTRPVSAVAPQQTISTVQPVRQVQVRSVNPFQQSVRVSSVADSTSSSIPKRLDQFHDIIEKASGEFEINPNLIKAVIAAESAGNPHARSSKNAKGLMQLIDSTATAMGVDDVWNPKQNIFGGSKYLKQLMDRFSGDTTLAVASYNAGPKAVEKHQGIPPNDETRQYVKRVMNYFQQFEQEGAISDEDR